MTNNYGRVPVQTQAQPDDWQTMSTRLIRAIEEYGRAVDSGADNYTLSVQRRAIDAYEQNAHPVIEKALTGLLTEKIANYQRDTMEVENARTAEAQRFDDGKVNASLELTANLINQAVQASNYSGAFNAVAPIGTRLRAIMADAQRQVEPSKQRGMLEALAGLETGAGLKSLNDRMLAAGVAGEAREALNRLRSPENLVQALGQLQKHQEELVEGIDLARQAAVKVGMMDPGNVFAPPSGLNRAIRRIRNTDEGIQILAADDPDVIGYDPHFQFNQVMTEEANNADQS